MTLRAENLRYGYGGAFALDVPRLEVAAGQVLAVVGTAGAGKSTLLRVVAGLLLPFEGKIAVGDAALDPRDPMPHRRRVGALFSRPARFRGTALENASAGLWAQGRPRKEAAAEARAWLGRVGAAELALRDAASLTDGEFQRVALARALAPGPQFLLLDEPFARLDTAARDAWVAEIGRLAVDAKLGVLLATQAPSEASRIADRVMVLEAGRVAQEGTPEELRAHPAEAAVASLFPRGA